MFFCPIYYSVLRMEPSRLNTNNDMVFGDYKNAMGMVVAGASVV